MNRGRNYFPFILKLDGKKLLFIGGGKVAEGKILRILDIADVVDITVFSKKITDKLESLHFEGVIKFIPIEVSEFCEDLLRDFDFIVASTEDKMLNSKIAEVAMKMGKFVLDVSNAENSNFFFPAVLNYDDTLVAISSFGKDKKRVKKIREGLEEFFELDSI